MNPFSIRQFDEDWECCATRLADELAEAKRAFSDASAKWVSAAELEPLPPQFPILMSAAGWLAAESVQTYGDFLWQRDHEGATHWMTQPGASK